MKTIQTDALGSLDGLRVVDVDVPVTGDDAVRIRVSAAGLNYVDALMVEGRYQIKPPVPYRPGSEVTGTVAEVGASAGEWRIGERVFAMPGMGGFSEEVVVHRSRVVRIPDTMTDGQAATFMQSYMTAWFAFTVRVPLEAGMTMLVTGAGGGVGLAAVDTARSRGVRVIAAASSEEKRALALAAGAEAVIDTGTEDVKARAREFGGGGVDVVYDPVGGALAESCLRALAPMGRYMVVGFVAGIPSLPANHVLLTNRSVVGVDWGAWMMANPRENAAMLADVMAAIGRGELHPVEPTIYPMSRAADAMRDLQGRAVAGKVALVPDFG